MAHFSATHTAAGSGVTIHFISLEFSALSPIGMWVPSVFEPSQAFLFGSLDFVTNQLGILHLREEATIPVPIGGAPSVSSGTPGNFNDEAPALCSEPTQGSNPTVSNISFVIYLLFTVFRQFSGGTPLSLS